MATKQLSPTGNLLRNSRLFSLPPPLPRPSGTLIAGQRLDSETATLPYPTQAAIETAPSSLAKGDWGLKRSLPLKSTTRTSTPVIRIGDVDSINHITDFNSAADHTLNLKKWQEIGLPVSKPEAQRFTVTNGSSRTGQKQLAPHKSVFEPADDNTEAGAGAEATGRWKYEGPWIAGQTQGEFNDFAEKDIRRRKEEFREFLRKRLAEKVTKHRRLEAQGEAESLPGGPAVISDHELNLHVKDLRNDEPELFTLIERFLDLPSGPHRSEVWSSQDSVEGPPTTHPSAGLTYLRAAAHTFNHPTLGPQMEEKPLRGRVLAPQASNRDKAIIGVGGIVTEGLSKLYASTASPGVHSFDPDLPGGAKLWVKPERVSIDSQGRIKLQTGFAEPATIALYQKQPEQLPREPRPDETAAGRRDIPVLTKEAPRPSPRNRKGYGITGGDPRTKPTAQLLSLLGGDGPGKI